MILHKDFKITDFTVLVSVNVGCRNVRIKQL